MVPADTELPLCFGPYDNMLGEGGYVIGGIFVLRFLFQYPHLHISKKTQRLATIPHFEKQSNVFEVI